jgi:hypothetical protein
MTDEYHDRLKADRRSFLEQCGRFAVVTPPVVSLMLATDSTRKALAASGRTTVTTATTATTFATITTTASPTTVTTAITTTSPTTITATTSVTFTTTAVTTDTIITTDFVTTSLLGMMDGVRGNSNHTNSQLAMIVDSMAVMKLS